MKIKNAPPVRAVVRSQNFNYLPPGSQRMRLVYGCLTVQRFRPLTRPPRFGAYLLKLTQSVCCTLTLFGFQGSLLPSRALLPRRKNRYITPFQKRQGVRPFFFEKSFRPPPRPPLRTAPIQRAHFEQHPPISTRTLFGSKPIAARVSSISASSVLLDSSVTAPHLSQHA